MSVYWCAKLIRARRATQGRTLQISIADITNAFPDYRVAFVVAEGLTIAPERPAELDALIAEREAEARAKWGGTELSQIPGIAAWRAAYKGFGIKQTRYRSPPCCRSARTISTASRRRCASAMRARATLSSTWPTRRKAAKRRHPS